MPRPSRPPVRACEPGTTRIGNCLLCPGFRASDLRRGSRPRGGGIGPDHDVGIENGEKRWNVSGPQRREERFHGFALAGQVGVGNRGRSLYPTPRAARELPRRGGRAADDRGDFLEGNREQVVQDSQWRRGPGCGEALLRRAAAGGARSRHRGHQRLEPPQRGDEAGGGIGVLVAAGRSFRANRSSSVFQCFSAWTGSWAGVSVGTHPCRAGYVSTT